MLNYILFKDEFTTEENTVRQKYSLSGVVCYINDQSSPDKRNLIALIKVPVSYLEERNKDFQNESRWYLFNDFNISPVPAHEAVWFSLDWKVPCILYYSSQEVLIKKCEVTQQLTRVSMKLKLVLNIYFIYHLLNMSYLLKVIS